MIIVFYDANSNKLHICSPTDKTRIISKNDPDLMSYIPNDDILYVTNGHYFTKQQFFNWLTGKMSIKSEPGDEIMSSGPSRHMGLLQDGHIHSGQKQSQAPSNKKYLHCKNPGSVLIEDIQTDKFPEGCIALHGKWQFIDVDTIGGIETLESSPFYRVLLKRGKIEIVDETYVQQHKHKANVKVSPSEQALNKILVPDGTPGTADKVAEAGGIEGAGGDIAVPIYITTGE